VTLASREVPVMVGLRLFLPESWTNDAARMDRAKVPEEAVDAGCILPKSAERKFPSLR
jgi:hypothetical protein